MSEQRGRGQDREDTDRRLLAQLHDMRNRLMPMQLRVDAGCHLAADTSLMPLLTSLRQSLQEVRELVEAMQATIADEVGDPAPVDPAMLITQGSQEDFLPGAPDQVSTIRILLVDDNELLAEALAEYIATDARFERMVHAPSAADARRLLETTMPDLIVLDLGLPDCHGLELCQEFRSAHPSIPVAVMSGMLDAQLLAEVQASDAGGFIAKGCEPGAMLDALLRLAGGERLTLLP